MQKHLGTKIHSIIIPQLHELNGLSVELLVVDVGLSNETFQKECVLDLILLVNVLSTKQSLRF